MNLFSQLWRLKCKKINVSQKKKKKKKKKSPVLQYVNIMMFEGQYFTEENNGNSAGLYHKVQAK